MKFRKSYEGLKYVQFRSCVHYDISLMRFSYFCWFPLRILEKHRRRKRYVIIYLVREQNLLKNYYFLSPDTEEYAHVRARSSHRRCFSKKDFFENFAKFIGKHLCQSLFFNKVAGLRHMCLPVNFAQFLRTPFFRTPLGD